MSPVPILRGRPKAEPTTQQRIRISAYQLAVQAAAAGGVSVTDVISQGTATLAAAVLSQQPAAEPAPGAVLTVAEAKRRAAKGKAPR